MRSDIAPTVKEFFRSQRKADLFTSALCVAEIGYGIARLPAGRRRDRLTATFDELMARQFRARILAFDEATSRAYAVARSQHERNGRTVAVVDMLIAATALAHGAAVATRNIRDFEPFGLSLINPWERR